SFGFCVCQGPGAAPLPRQLCYHTTPLPLCQLLFCTFLQFFFLFGKFPLDSAENAFLTTTSG
ncbi:hypothetical protein, partial [Yanshouia hominis]|uniref:hypothetical protein n=1 Tax=Yanshouia hominis TaxID=2763673 RepID=UPI0021CCB432